MGKTSLNYHIDVAHSVKPVLKCLMCKKTFNHEQSLKGHKSRGRCYIASHLNRFRSKCKLCHKAFSRKDNLTVHKEKVHGLYNIDFDKAEENRNPQGYMTGSIKVISSVKRLPKIF